MKVKILAEERMKKMDKELKFSKKRLNQQPVRSLWEKPVRRKEGRGEIRIGTGSDPGRGGGGGAKGTEAPPPPS